MARIEVPEPATDAADDTAGWSDALERVCSDPTLIEPYFQPIVDLGRGAVAGYEMLARFRMPMGQSPAEWFDAAGRLGYVEALDALMLGLAVEALPRLHANQFLTVNLTPRGAVSPQVAAAMGRGQSMEALVIELTEQTAITDTEQLADAAKKMRSHGALLAVDDAGAGYGSLQRILSLRPEFVKIDRSFIAEIHTDEARAAATEMIGMLASRIDSWVIAEGVERPPERDRLVQMGIPLAQGYLFARPAPELEQVDATWASRRTEAALHHPEDVSRLVEAAEAVAPGASRSDIGARFAADPGLDFVPVVDGRGRPTGLLRRDPGGSGWAPADEPMRIHPDSVSSQVLQRAMTRPQAERLSPLACCDELGRYVGMVRVERLIEELTSG